MLEVLIRLEHKRKALRRRALGHFGDRTPPLYAMAGVIAIALATGAIVPPAAAATAPPEITAIAVAIGIGLVLSCTVILLPVGLLFF